MSTSKQPARGVVEVAALHIADAHSIPVPTQTQVVEEDALSLDIEGVGLYMLMWTPTVSAQQAHGFTLEDGVLGDIESPEGLALAMGFALTEGLIQSLADLKSVAVCADNPKLVKVQLHHPEAVVVTRKDVLINSSCGICGPREILEDNALGLRPLTQRMQLNRADFIPLMAAMRDRQPIFQETGGSHAAAIFDNSGNVIAVAEDLGRHNALDKVIGTVLLERGNLNGCGVILSSRLSLEMVLKAVRAGLEIMLAVSAPTSLAIQVAEKYGVTLCGFVRESRATIYTHTHRIL